MGVNASCKLTQGADWRKVGQVASVLLGAKVNIAPLGANGWYAVVSDFGYGNHEATSDPAYINILVSGDPKNPAAKAIAKSDGLPYKMWYGLENRFLYPKGTAAKIALVEGITKFFGGVCEYNDCSGKSKRFKDQRFVGENDEVFYRFQEALMALQPLTKEDIERCEKFAAY